MNAGGCAISLPGVGIGHVADGLYVGYAVEKDVRLRKQPAIGYAAKRSGECQRLLCKVDFQELLGAARAEYQI